jgi:hypothetical protein
MKKIIISIVALLFMGITAVFADGTKTCKVSGTTGSVEVSVYDGNKQEGTASMSFSNDTDADVNVRYKVTFTKDGRNVAERSGSKRVPPHSEATATVSAGKAYDNVTVSAVSGEKCD